MAVFKEMNQSSKIKVIFGVLLALLIPLAGTIMTDAPVIWPVSTLIYNLGLLYSFTIVPKGAARIIAYNIIASIFFVIESSFFFSYYLQNAGFNEAFFYHIRPDLLYAGLNENLPILLGMILCLLGFLILSSSSISRERARKIWMPPLALGLLVFGLFISPPAKALVNYVENFSLANKDNDLFQNFPELQSSKLKVEFSKQKKNNIVLIYTESLEQRFFDETLFPNLVPNLKRLKEQSIDFSNVSQGVGAGWTIGGIVASQCAYPLSVSHDVNRNDLSMFDEFLPNAICLGDLLGKDGYNLTFIGGADARFAGKGDFLGSHGYKEVLGFDDLQATLSDQSYVNAWGVFDDTLFDYALRKFMTMSSEESPFLLTLLTLDNHGPIGYLSKSCETYGLGQNSSLNSIHCTDQLVSKFIEQIRNSPYSKDTIIIVLSDHLAMRNKATDLLETSQMPRRLTFFVNTPDSKREQNTNPGIHYDIAPTILDFVGYKIVGQMGFGAPLTQGPGYLPSKFGEGGWRKQSANLMAISNALWNNDVTLDRDGIKFTMSNLVLAMGGREFALRAGGISEVPSSTLFIFDDRSLKLEKIKSYPLDEGLERETLSKELLQHKEKLALVISRAGNLPGFSNPRTHPDQWVFFCGKPGSDFFSWGSLSGDLLIPFDLIRKLSKSKMDDRVVRERENLLKALEGNSTSKLGR